MIPSLNGLRALAILLVLFAHISVVPSTPTLLVELLHPVANGELGVRLFFVISGFLITWLLLREKEKSGRVNLGRFYIRRFLRIFPVFYFYLAVVFLTGIFTGRQVDQGVMVGALLYLHNFAFWGSDWLIAHTWSLAVEEQFYLVWPWVFRRTGNGWKMVMPVMVLLIGALARMIGYKFPELSNFLLLPFFRHFDFLLGGCYLAFYRFHQKEALRNLVQRINGWWLAAGLVMVFFLGYLETHPTLDRIFLPVAGTITVLYFMLLIAWFTDTNHSGNMAYRLLNLGWVNQFGILSYSFYVWQQFFLVPAYHHLAERWWTRFPINIFFLIGAVYFSYYVIERPFLRIKERFR